jgi:hypothetical protein
MGKIKLDVTLVPNVFTCCYLLHNLILSRHDEDISKMLQILELETIEDNVQRNVATIDAKVQVGLEGHDLSSEEHRK